MSNNQFGGEKRSFNFIDFISTNHNGIPAAIFVAGYVFIAICTLCFPNTFFKTLFIIMSFVIIFGAFLYYIISSKDNENFEYGKERKITFEFDSINDGFDFIKPDHENGMYFEDLTVQGPVAELKDLCDYIREPGLFNNLGYIPESKIVLIGSIGSGKNALITAFANETDLPVLRVHASRFFDVEGLLESLFKLAPYFENYIIQIDSFELFSTASSNDAFSVDLPDVILDNLENILKLILELYFLQRVIIFLLLKQLK